MASIPSDMLPRMIQLSLVSIHLRTVRFIFAAQYHGIGFRNDLGHKGGFCPGRYRALCAGYRIERIALVFAGILPVLSTNSATINPFFQAIHFSFENPR